MYADCVLFRSRTDGKLVKYYLSVWLCWRVQGNCAENTAKKVGVTRDEQDEYGMTSYRRTQAAVTQGIFKKEIVPVVVTSKKGRCR